MGIKERRERERQITKQGILTASLEIARQSGWSAVTIRKVGESIEYSAPMVYQYFASKEEILLELLRIGFDELGQAMQEAIASTEDKTERILRAADAYWQFAQNNPERYQLMHGLGGVTLAPEAFAGSIKQTCELAENTLVDWAQAKGVTLEDSLGAAEIVWSLLHGLISVSLAERVQGGKDRARNLVQRSIQDLLKAWSMP